MSERPHEAAPHPQEALRYIAFQTALELPPAALVFATDAALPWSMCGQLKDEPWTDDLAPGLDSALPVERARCGFVALRDGLRDLPAAGVTSIGASADPTEDEQVSISVAGSSEVARTLFVYRELGGASCAATAYQQYTPTEPGTYRICAYLAETSSSAPLAAATSTVTIANDPSGDPASGSSYGDDYDDDGAPAPSNAPAPPISLIAPGVGQQQNDRRPTFQWHAADGYSDNLIVEDEHGEPVVLVRSDGTFAATSEDDEDVVDTDDYEDDWGDEEVPESERTTFDSWYMERVGKTGVAVRDGMAQVRLGSALPPGRYRWRVERSLDNRVVAKVGPRPLTLLGPRLSRLRVHAVSRSYKSSRNPGHTRLKISASPYASLRITFARSGRKRVLRYGLDRSSHGTVRIDWTRRVRGAGHYRWTVQASDGYTARIASAYRANRDELNVAASSPTR